jgi:hypothetical protein
MTVVNCAVLFYSAEHYVVYMSISREIIWIITNFLSQLFNDAVKVKAL